MSGYTQQSEKGGTAQMGGPGSYPAHYADYGHGVPPPPPGMPEYNISEMYRTSVAAFQNHNDINR